MFFIIPQDGAVTFIPPLMLKTTCSMDVTWFPFDSQICPIRIGSWTYSGDEISLQVLDDGYTEDELGVVRHGEWSILSFKGARVVKMFTCCPEAYHNVDYILVIKRQTMYYFFNLIVPCALIGKLKVERLNFCQFATLSVISVAVNGFFIAFS